MTPEPIFDLAHLGHMELLTPKPDESLKFFVDVMGMILLCLALVRTIAAKVRFLRGGTSK